jgi:catechol-2,3-dioxygenase
MTIEPADDATWILHGPGRLLQFGRGPAKQLKGAGFAVRDEQLLHGLRARAERQGLQPLDANVAFFRSDSFSVTDPDGNAIVFGIATTEGAETAKSPQGVLQHLTLATENTHALERFYVDGLGFAVSDRVVHTDGRLMSSFMRSNSDHHTLACFFQQRRGVDHHAYEVGAWNGIRDWADRFAARGIPLMWGPGRHGPGNNLFIFIVDPDGNWIEMSTELEVVHDRPAREWPHAERTLNLWGKGLLRA